MRQLLRTSGEKFLNMTIKNFGSGGSYRETTWPPLSAEYAKRVKSSTPTDKRTGALMESIKVGPVKDKSVEVYTRNPYAAFVAFGTKKMKPRNFWPIENHGSPSYHRLMFGAEKEMFATITKKLTSLSSGALPYQSSMQQRAPISQGSPWGT
jgi:phage gpG-like protein